MKSSDFLHKPVVVPIKNTHHNHDGTVYGYSQFASEVFAQEGLNHEQEHNKWQEKTKSQLHDFELSSQEGEYKIPPITHSVYLTSTDDPNPMKDLYIDNYSITSLELTKKDPNFIHNLWVNFDPNDQKFKDIIPQEIRDIPNLQIRNIYELEDHSLYQNTIDFIDNGRASSKYVEASDLIRVMAMEVEGGIYHDLDWKLYDADEMIKYMRSFDFIGGREGEDWKSSIGNAFFASKANHPVVKKLAQIIERNLNAEENSDLVPDYIKYPEREFDRIIFKSGPIAITIAYHLASDTEGNHDLICPSKILYNADYARDHKWGGKHNTEDLANTWEGIKIKTIGGDQFSGNWGHTYLEKINYNPSIMMNPLMKSVINNNKQEFDRILTAINLEDNIEREYVNSALAEVIKLNRIDMFNQLLPKVTDKNSLEMALRNAVRNNQKKMFEQLLPKITDQISLIFPLSIAVEYNLKDMFEHLLLKATDEGIIASALFSAIISDRKEIVAPMLLKITDQNKLGEALVKAVDGARKDIFEQILLKVTDSGWLEKALLSAISRDDRMEMVAPLLLKITDQNKLGEALVEAVSYNRKELFEHLLPKITDKEWLGKALYKASLHKRREIFEQLLTKVTDQKWLEKILDDSIRFGDSEQVSQLSPKFTDQKWLGMALQYSLSENIQELFERLLPKLTDQKWLEAALHNAKIQNTKEMVDLIEKRIFAINHPVLEFTTSTLKAVNNWMKEHDPIKLASKAEAVQLTGGRDPSPILTAASGNANSILAISATKALPSGDNIHNINNHPVHSSSVISAEKINDNLFMGITTLAFTMKALGLNTDWLKPALGGKTADIKMDSDPRTFSTINPEYDYIAKIKEMAKKAPPLEQAALVQITELAKSGTSAEWSKEQWQNFIKNNKEFKAFIDVMEVAGKQSAASSRPLTEQDIKPSFKDRISERKRIVKNLALLQIGK